ncbi:caspase-8-like [Cololabis saira]|uniref:caspase-8-like n=1 Tax=Cololabis saira TaxID=129043 RepID=UPI002AD3C762|nr:caspase-8-like [Cololabis saira]XP_061588996.1 caspase-8-like [Cololabis saira]
MDRLTLSHIDEQLDSSNVAELCFLCSDVINRKRLEGIEDAKKLFMRLEEKGLLENSCFLSQLLRTIHRADLLGLLQPEAEETDANPVLAEYRVMLYNIYEDMTTENLEKMKYLLSSDLGRRQLEISDTALDVFLEMEKMGLISRSNVQKLHELLQQFDQKLASTVHNYMQGQQQQRGNVVAPHVSMDQQKSSHSPRPSQVSLSTPDTELSYGGVDLDSEPVVSYPDEYYRLVHNPRGLCVVFNNEDFSGTELSRRGGTREDATALENLFSRLGFTVQIYKDFTAAEIRLQVQNLAKRNFLREDALVVCVLSHGEKGCVFGTDQKKLWLRELTEPFRSGSVPTLAGKPKLFFIQACQGSGYQQGSLPSPADTPEEEGDQEEQVFQEDAGPVRGDTVPSDADFLLGMATVPECKSFRNTTSGSIYIQELCRQLGRSARSSDDDDILAVLTRVNREVSKGVYLSFKQMPEPKYTLTKKLVLKFVDKSTNVKVP